jgi:hypothetical protein
MEPTYYANTTEFRGYQRASPEKRAASYSPDKKQFFGFIEDRLDFAVNDSVLNETLILFRGISPNIAGLAINNSEYFDLAFSSTSYDPTVCIDLFGPRSKDGYLSILVMQRLPGKDALYVNEYEREFILPRDTTWDVIRAVDVEDLTVQSDFPLHKGALRSANFQKVRLIYIREKED